MSIDSVNSVNMYSQVPQYNYGRTVNYQNEVQLHVKGPKHQLPEGNVGGGKIDLVIKGTKFIWKNCKNFFLKLFKSDKDITDHINDWYKIYDTTDAAIDLYNDLNVDLKPNKHGLRPSILHHCIIG